MTWVVKNSSILFWCFLEIYLTLKPRHRWSFSAACQGLSCPCWCSLLVQREKKSNCNFNVNANNFNFNVSVNLHHLKWRIPARFCCQHASGRGNPEEAQGHQVDFSPLMDYSHKTFIFTHERLFFLTWAILPWNSWYAHWASGLPWAPSSSLRFGSILDLANNIHNR